MSTQSTDPGEGDEPSVETLVTALQRAATAHEEARDRVEAAGENRLQQLREHYEEMAGLLDRYEAQVTSDGETDVDMEAFIEFQEEIARFVETLPEDIDHREAFETVDETMHQKWLKSADFETARAALEPIGDLVERLEERERTLERYREARHDVAVRERELAARIAELEDLVALGDADLDAPVETLREPIEAYNQAIAEAFDRRKHEDSARELLAFAETTAAYPLVDYRLPPEDLVAYVTDSEAGTEPVPTLLEYADYSVSKLEHYVPDARRLKRNVATHQTYLRRLDSGPLTVSWPPPAAEELRWRCRELIALVGRIAPEAVVTKLRTVRGLARTSDYERLRESIRAREQLTDAERDRLARGDVEAELAALGDERDQLTAALEAHPER
ncbi:Uncharacterized protein SVXHr_2773 [Halorhabdus sp. SVX81]|uniref:DUF7118 family protein n=1 Tax=Halorhabdus sp. SVX81 TaxID=2978283 RepID=UPI0023DB0C3F|nr:hypothetical protein [Halorhabdus sp. SVX81]WEL18916.1 Uncharacterized protein SVXHr_2773 [Halorhabdus sp. SVX81]